MPKAMESGDEKFSAMLSVGSPFAKFTGVFFFFLKVWKWEMLPQILVAVEALGIGNDWSVNVFYYINLSETPRVARSVGAQKPTCVPQLGLHSPRCFIDSVLLARLYTLICRPM